MPVSSVEPQMSTEAVTKSLEMTTSVTVKNSSPIPEFSKGKVLEKIFYSDVLKDDLRYLIYLPSNYQTDSLKYPVLYLLHGRGDSMYSWLAIQADIDRLIASGIVPPFIAVIPDVPYSKRASYYVDSEFTGELFPGKPVESAIIKDLIPEIDNNYSTIANRSGRAVIGYSMGGFGALRFILQYPEHFMAAILLSPAVYIPLPPNDSSMRLFGAFGKDEKVFDEVVYQEKNYPALIPSFEEKKIASLCIYCGWGR